MREKLDRGLEPIGDVIPRVINTIAYLWQRPWLEQKNIAKKRKNQARQSTMPIVVERTQTNADGRTGKRHLYWCPGCDSLHGIAIRPHTQDNGAGWSFTGTLECPTYSPSQKSTWNNGKQEMICHTFIRGGIIEFLNDCTHALKGQKVPLPPLPDWVVNDQHED